MSDRQHSDHYTPNENNGLSINALLMLCFALIALVPVTILGIKIYNASWENALREVKEKHQLLAENLSAPISIYVNSHLTSLTLAADQIGEITETKNVDVLIDSILSKHLQYADGFSSILLLSNKTEVLNFISDDNDPDIAKTKIFGVHDFINKALIRNEPAVSSVIVNPFTRQPAIYIATPIITNNNLLKRKALVAELKILPIEKLRQGIRFGLHGHSAIVDNVGNVIAHPNPDWMKDQIKNLSNLSIVKSMMAGKTGVTEFYSPFKKEDMVAGYTAVPDLGWGIMVPQPKSEVESHVQQIIYAQLGWGIIGLILAIITAHFLGRWITQPINALASAGHKLSKEGFHHNLPKIRDTAPFEIRQLSSSFSDAIHGLSISRAEVEELNRSLQYRVNAATTELRQANTKLGMLARSDHLTKLANRRHFEQTLMHMTSRREEDDSPISLLLVDVDNFKRINDQYGHAAGDTVLVQIADILDRNTRQTDLAARYAGDEFVILIHADVEIGRERAALIRAEIASNLFHFEKSSINVTVSIGLVTFNLADHKDTVDAVLRKVDEAMYSAKRKGRNRVAELMV